MRRARSTVQPGSSSASPGGRAGSHAVRTSPAAIASRRSWPAASSSAVAGRTPSSGTPASTRPHSWATSIASNAPRPAPPWSSEISMPGQPASTASGHRSGAAAGSSSAARAAAIVPARARDPRAASRRSSCSSVRARFIAGDRRRFPLPAAELAERDPLVEPRLRRQPEHALADRVAQDLLGAARRLQARQERDHVRPLAAVLERVGAEVSAMSSPAAIAALTSVTFARPASGPGICPRCSAVSAR